MEWIPGRLDRRRSRSGRGLPTTIEVLETRLLLADGISGSPAPTIHGSPGVPLNNVQVATFTITDSSGEPGTKWDCEIIWGDGSMSKLVPATAGPNGTFQFLGTHTYTAANTYSITVMIAVPGSHKPNDNVVTTKAVIAAPATLKSIAVTPGATQIAIGTTQQFTANGSYSDGSTRNITNQVAWSSNNTKVAGVSTTGLAQGLTTGSANISASLDGHTGTALLNVSNSTLVSLAVTPANPSIPIGGKQQFVATGTFSDHSTQNLTNDVTWTSSNTSVASISRAGLAEANAQGDATITATFRGASASTSLHVQPPPPPPFIAIGQHIQATVKKTFTSFVAYVKIPNTKTQDIHAFISWGDGSKATHGHIHGLGYGHYAIIGSHRYVKPGIFHVGVVISDPRGQKVTAPTLVKVIGPPQPSAPSGPRPPSPH